MATETFMKHCGTCKRNTPHIRKSASNVLHLLMSIITFGLWLPVWLIIGFRNSVARPLCTVCGKDTMLGQPVEPTPWWATVLVALGIIVAISLAMKH